MLSSVRRAVKLWAIMAEHLLTVPEAARALRVTPWTLRKWLNEGTLQGVRPRPGGRWRVPQSALDRIAQTPGSTRSDESATGSTTAGAPDTPSMRAAAILEAMRSGDMTRRNAAIVRLAGSDEATYELVQEAVEAAEAAYDGPQGDMSDWCALDGEPFHFPEEPADYLEGLYKSEEQAA